MKYALEEYLPYIVNNSTDFFENKVEESEVYYVSKPKNWKIQRDSHWVYVINTEINLPKQGWKIHISAGYKDAQDLLTEVSNYLVSNNVNFKFTASKKEWLLKNSKSADRAESGKFITIYPNNALQMKSLVVSLAELTAKYSIGPYILSDKRYKESHVFYRYGAFQEIRNSDGILCIEDEFGNLVPDKRVPYYVEPDFVDDPFEEEKSVDNKDFEKLAKYDISSALQFSNAGGVYLGKSGGKKFVIKEGRQAAGIDANLSDGFTRIKHEAEILKGLNNSNYVVNYQESFKVWIHYYLVEDYIESENLGDFITNKYPFHCDKTEYLNKVKYIAQELFNAVEDIHKYGVAIGDLHPENILLYDNCKKIKLIDFEQATQLNRKFDPGLITKGFVNPNLKTYGQEDWFALYKIVEYAIYPLIDISDLVVNDTDEKIRLSNLYRSDRKLWNFLINFKRKCFEKGNIPFNDFYYGLNIDYSEKLLDTTISKIINGISKNLDFSSLRLIKGDIDQFLSQTGFFNVSSGAMGLGLVIQSFDKDSQLKFKQWCLSNWDKLASAAKLDSGLFTGAAGIGSVIYSQVRKNLGRKLLDDINWKNNITDLSLRSGLAGIGLAKLALAIEENSQERISEIVEIANYVNQNYSKCLSSGLLDGKLGVILFLEKVGKALCKDSLVKDAKNKLELFLRQELYATGVGLFLTENKFSQESYTPYLNSGTVGLLLVLLEFEKDNLSVNGSKKLIEELIQTNDVELSYMNGLFDGFAGLILGDIAAKNNGYRNFYGKKIQSMYNYLVVTDEMILTPGAYGLKNSMDLITGAIGILTVLLGLKENNWGKWLPIIPSKKINLFNNEKGGE